jgi:hypothetical protein
VSGDLTSWVRLDDAWLHNPKVRKAGVLGRALYIAAICYAHRQNTDGSIDADVIDLLATEAGLTMEQANEAASRLLEVGLFEREASGWVVHDYVACQETKAQRDAVRESAKARQRRSRARFSDVTRDAFSSDDVSGNAVGSDAEWTTPPTDEASEAIDKSRSEARHADVTRDSHVSHSEVTPREVEVEVEKRESDGADAPPPPVKRAARKTGVPDSFEPDEARREWAAITVPAVNIHSETPKFIDFHQAKGSIFADHQKAWQNWMRRADEYRTKDARSQPPRPAMREHIRSDDEADYELSRQRIRQLRGVK